MTRQEIAALWEVHCGMPYPKNAYPTAGTSLGKLDPVQLGASVAGCASSYLNASRENPLEEWKVGVLAKTLPTAVLVIDHLTERYDIAYFRLIEILNKAVLDKARAGDYD